MDADLEYGVNHTYVYWCDGAEIPWQWLLMGKVLWVTEISTLNRGGLGVDMDELMIFEFMESGLDGAMCCRIGDTWGCTGSGAVQMDVS